MATNTQIPTWDNRRRLLVLEKSVLEAGECVERRYERLEELHCRFDLLRGCIRTSFFTDFSLQQNVTMLKDMRVQPLYDFGKVVVRLQRKIGDVGEKIDPAVYRVKALLREFHALKA
jgi:hypothetical protein